MVLCCALPVLIAGGILVGFDGVLRSPWLIGAGAPLLVADQFHTKGRADR